MTLKQLLEQGKKELEAVKVPEAELSAWYLLQACFGDKDFSFSRSNYFLRQDETVSKEIQEQYFSSVEKRKQRIPLEYITGYTEFMGMVFEVDENVLIPRQDTEILVENILSYCTGKKVLDMCTGSGCIGLSIAAIGKPSEVVLSDISAGALRMAEKNLLRIRKESGADGCHDFCDDIHILCGDLWEPIEGKFDVIVSNPPYIESEVIEGLMPEVRDFEPMSALDGGADGLDFYREIVSYAPQYLNSRGMLSFEIGYNQGESVSALMRENGFLDVCVTKDFAGNDRVVTGKWKE